jgi:hypothetical protein
MNKQDEIDEIIIHNMSLCAEYQMKVVAARLILRGCKDFIDVNTIKKAVCSEAGKLKRFVNAMYTKDETISCECYNIVSAFINNLKNDTIHIIIETLNENGGVYNESI